jgi:hypothetical protein
MLTEFELGELEVSHRGQTRLQVEVVTQTAESR